MTPGFAPPEEEQPADADNDDPMAPKKGAAAKIESSAGFSAKNVRPQTADEATTSSPTASSQAWLVANTELL